MRISKCKMGAVGRLEKHHERLKDEYKSNPDIDISRIRYDYHVKYPTEKDSDRRMRNAQRQCCYARLYMYGLA